MYAGGSTGLAVLRRDGFASLEAPESGGNVTTRLVRFKGRYLFVNLQAAEGSLQAEILDRERNPNCPFFPGKQHPPESGQYPQPRPLETSRGISLAWRADRSASDFT